MERGVSSCLDFLQFVCGKWTDVHPKVSSPYRIVETKVVYPAQKDMLKITVNPLQTLATDKVTAAVQNCYAVGIKKVENLQALSAFLLRNGIQLPPVSGQPVPSPLELLVKLNLRLRIPLLFTLRPAIDLRTEDRMILTFKTNTYNIGQFGFDMSNISIRAATHVNGEKFAKEVQDVQTTFLSWIQVDRRSTARYLSVTELANVTPSISETEWLNAINPNLLSPITAGTYVYAYDSKGIFLVNKLMREYKDNPRPAANWITMFVYHYFAGASSYRLPKLFLNYQDRCFTYRLNDIVVILGTDGKFYSPVAMEKQYSYLPAFKGPFIEDLLQTFRNRAEVELYRLAHSRGKLERDTSVFTELKQFGNAFYTPHLHTVYIPSAMLTGPFVMRKSLVATYGLIGTTLGHEISHAFGPNSIDKLPTGVQEKWMTDQTWQQYRARKDCIIDLYSSQLERRNYSLMTLNENFADILGMEIVLAAMRNDPCVNLNAPSPIQGLSNMELFFVAYCFKHCTAENPAHYYGRNYASKLQRCLTVSEHSKAFFDAFKCVPKPTPCHLL
ncbi:unnamed protein product [Ixodes hexagonus]